MNRVHFWRRSAWYDFKQTSCEKHFAGGSQRRAKVAHIMFEGVKQLRESRLLSTIYHEARLRRACASDTTPILVYQMGKVGSSSIVDSLKAMKLDRPIFHMHFLNPENIQRAERMLREIYGGRYNVNRWALYESRFVIRHFLQRPNRGLKIVSLVREPVARNVSSFFQNIDKFIPDCAARYDTGQIGVAEIARHYLRDFHEHSYPLTWFDDEMKSVFEIDVYSLEDMRHRDRRTFVYRRNSVELLVLRTEDIYDVAQQALQEFLEVAEFSLRNANVAHDKNYDRAYRDFREKLRLPDEYLTQMYESKFARHFYSAPEIEKFYSHWSRR